MHEVANYCTALSGAFGKTTVSQINDYRKVTSIAHVSLFNSYYHANGMKIRNFLDAYAFKYDMVFSIRVYENIEKGKYPDTLIMVYNSSSDKIILIHREADIA
ncbi:hypothetical protein C1645_830970 [Glomus cerebriforme]|uniref:Uncharacterized protein n=1 Tax=Glomus cerebriforme TaxID=658196 RepID=A0A397SR59_9GLOM|nr:hypothetical protein C1645_830970 [Glomus cerebriforme]